VTGQQGDEGRVAELAASRARVVAAADELRRRLQQDLHDGAQQELVHVVIALKLARAAVDPGSPAADLVSEALAHAERAGRLLRDVVQGLLPGSLVHGGLRAGLASLVDDLPLAVDLRVTAPRLPPAAETTAYLVVAEALADVVEHAHAGSARVRADMDGDVLVVEVGDDGVGGADRSLGTGLLGLHDRIAAAQGRLTVVSPPGGGTVVRAELPVPSGSGGADRSRARVVEQAPQVALEKLVLGYEADGARPARGRVVPGGGVGGDQDDTRRER
jgi:signal transduction histidine kinase